MRKTLVLLGLLGLFVQPVFSQSSVTTPYGNFTTPRQQTMPGQQPLPKQQTAPAQPNQPQQVNPQPSNPQQEITPPLSTPSEPQQKDGFQMKTPYGQYGR